VVLVGAVAMVTGLLLTSVVDSIVAGYITYGFGIGIGGACCYVPLVSQVSGWFDRRRPAALGIAVSGIGVGTLVGPPLANALIEANGWRWTYRLLAIVSAVGLVVAASLAERAPRGALQEPLDLRRVARSSVFRRLYVSGLLMTLALFVPFVFLKPYAEDNGIGSAAAAALISMLGLGSLVGRIGLGAFAGRLGVLRVYQLCFVVLGVSYLIWLVGGANYVMLALFAFVLGASYGGYVALSPAAAAELFGLSGLGAVLGALYTAGGIGGLIGPSAAGWLIDSTGSYTPAIVAAMVLGMASVVILRPAIRAAAATVG
jgi:MFS family permease